MSPQERAAVLDSRLPERLKDCCDNYQEGGFIGERRCTNCPHDRIDHAIRKGWARELAAVV